MTAAAQHKRLDGRIPQDARMQLAAQQRDYTRAVRASARVRYLKCFLALAFAILFWLSVPYKLPRHLATVDAVAAAQDTAEQFEGSGTRQIAVPLLAACAAYMLWRFPVRGRLGGRLFILVVLYVGWLLCSFTWSEDPQLSSKRLFVFALDCFFTYAAARTLSTMEMALGAFLATFSTGLISVFCDIFLLKDFAPADPEYRLMGVMAPNHQAMNLVACCLCCTGVMLRKPKWVPWLSVLLTIALAMLWITRARIGTILCLGLLLFAANRFLRDHARPQVRTLVLLGIFAVLAPGLVFLLGNNPGKAAQSAFMMGRNDTQNTSNLSNRLPLWQELMSNVEDHPWLGFGYGAFWTTARSARISKDQGWSVPHAHNSYLDQTIATGVVGGALYTAIMVSALVVAWGRYRRLPSSTNFLNAALLTWLVLLSLSESAPLDPHMPTLLVYIAVVRMCLREGSVDTADPVRDAPIVEGLPIPPQAALPPATRLSGGSTARGSASASVAGWRTPVLSSTLRRQA